MSRFLLALPGLLLLVACSGAPSPAPLAASTNLPGEGTCRTGPEGGPLTVADRGIGGTGITAEDGDRGIGGTGIVGVITGFASICVNGLEVGYAPGAPVDFEDEPGTVEGLRAGQVVVIEAGGSHDRLRARSLAVRHEVSGPVEQFFEGAWLVAGQHVVPDAKMYAEGLPGGRPAVGDWVVVSGLRRPDGGILATRMDRREPGRVTVHGLLTRTRGVLRIGGLALRLRPGALPPPSGPTTASGRYQDGVLLVDSLSTDLLVADPATRFGPGVSRLVIESYISLTGNQVALGDIRMAAPGGSRGFGPGPRRGVLDLRRQPGGGFVANDLRSPGTAPRLEGFGSRGQSGPVPSVRDMRGDAPRGEPGGFRRGERGLMDENGGSPRGGPPGPGGGRP